MKTFMRAPRMRMATALVSNVHGLGGSARAARSARDVVLQARGADEAPTIAIAGALRSNLVAQRRLTSHRARERALLEASDAQARWRSVVRCTAERCGRRRHRREKRVGGAVSGDDGRHALRALVIVGAQRGADEHGQCKCRIGEWGLSATASAAAAARS